VGGKPSFFRYLLRQIPKRTGAAWIRQGEPACIAQPRENCVFLDRKLIEGDVIFCAREGRRQLLLPACGRLAGTRIDQIERITLKMGPRQSAPVKPLGRGVPPAEFFKIDIVYGLHTKRDTVDPCRAEAIEALCLGTGRISFKRNLRVSRNLP